ITSAAIGAFLFTLVSPGNIQRFKTIGVSIQAFVFGTGIEDRALTTDEASAKERVLKNRHTWELIKQNPMIGVGINPNPGLYPEDLFKAPGDVHFELLRAGSQMGIPGMLIYLSFLSMAMMTGWKMRQRFRHIWTTVSDLGWLICMQTVVFVVAGSFSPAVWNYPFMILMGVAGAAAANMREFQIHQPMVAPQPVAQPQPQPQPQAQTQPA
ncbi:MAG: O-antigen ligase family protein, partial [Verrucomicrobiota bacterium]